MTMSKRQKFGLAVDSLMELIDDGDFTKAQILKRLKTELEVTTVSKEIKDHIVSKAEKCDVKGKSLIVLATISSFDVVKDGKKTIRKRIKYLDSGLESKAKSTGVTTTDIDNYISDK